MTLEFTVFGVAQPKGSTKAFAYPLKNRATGQPIIGRNGKPVYAAATTSDNPKVKGWQQLVAEGANRALAAAPDTELLTEGVRLTVAFFLPRPKKYQRAGVEPTHLTKPDVDKCLRSILDSLTKVVWLDDSQVVELVAVKRYAPLDKVPHVTIRVEPTAGTRPIVVPAAPLPLLEALL